jgi:8-oxo-dGTP pyrophosphatase MutT (NUDIX family)
MTVQTRYASTIVILRPAAERFEVFMVQRHRASGFLPDAWVFPGGRVDAGDALEDVASVHGGETVAGLLGIEPRLAYSHMVAGVRETFEEAGIWLGEGGIPEAERYPLASREDSTTLLDLLERYDATIELDDLYYWSWWVTPKFEKKRYDTRFFLAVVDDKDGSHDNTETVDSGWFSPHELLATKTQDTFPLAPPTWWTLFELARHESIADVLEAAKERPICPIQPITSFEEDGLKMLLPGHPEHPESAIPLMPTSVSLIGGQWVGGGIEFPDFPSR